jgi:NADP-dependent 3-hydroxy acid dehydrogenase YdfG
MAMKKGTELLKDLFDISGKVALITGATGGFGHTASMALAMAGVKVMATGRDEKKLKPLIQEIEKEGGVAACRVAH